MTMNAPLRTLAIVKQPVETTPTRSLVPKDDPLAVISTQEEYRCRLVIPSVMMYGKHKPGPKGLHGPPIPTSSRMPTITIGMVRRPFLAVMIVSGWFLSMNEPCMLEVT